MLAPELIHFYRRATGVSLELPLGFTELTSDRAGQSMVWVDEEADDAPPHVAAFVDIRVLDGDSGAGAIAGSGNGAFPATGNGDGGAAVTAVMDGFAAHASEELARDWLQIDGERVLRAELHFPTGLPGVPGPSGGQSTAGAVADFLTGDLLVVIAVVVFGGRLVSITATAPWSTQAAWRETFDRALQSARFLPEAGA